MTVTSFSAICNDNTHSLILGTMPGVASLNEQQYYAHKRNALWPIVIASVKQVQPDYALHDQYDYNDKVEILQSAGLGLWDVLAQCERQGSLDSAIKQASVVNNDFVSLLKRFPNIKRFLFNGKSADALFKRHVLPELLEAGFTHHNNHIENPHESDRRLVLASLPSTSPAMASLDLSAKSRLWQRVLLQSETIQN